MSSALLDEYAGIEAQSRSLLDCSISVELDAAQLMESTASLVYYADPDTDSIVLSVADGNLQTTVRTNSTPEFEMHGAYDPQLHPP